MNIGIVYLLSIFGIKLIFEYLIRKNIIKPSKISRIFYQDDEIFINSWEKAQRKGILKYMIQNIIFITVVLGIIGSVFILYKPQHLTMFEYLSIGVILGLIHYIFWSDNQNRYKKLKEKENKEKF